MKRSEFKQLIQEVIGSVNVYPSEFFWQDQHQEPDKVAQSVKFLNSLSKDQFELVRYYANSLMNDDHYSRSEDQ